MDAKERATKFVRKYPNMFTEDQDWWIGEIGLIILEAQNEQMKADKIMVLKIVDKVTA